MKETGKCSIFPVSDHLNDGQWHEISLLLTQFRFNITVDYEPEFSLTRNNLTTTDRFTFGAMGDQVNRETAMNGFVGCIRQLIMSGIQILPRDFHNNLTNAVGMNGRAAGTVINHGVLIDACEMFDRCTPNPCRHGGICSQVRYNCYMSFCRETNPFPCSIIRHGLDFDVIVRKLDIVEQSVILAIILCHVWITKRIA